MSPALLEFRGISKSFGENHANQSISFSLRQGRIHALVGENGAGKSTLMKILFGLESADSGQLFFKGELVQIKNPKEAKRLGFGMIHQHFQLAPALTALDHVILEEPSRKFSFFEKLDRTGWLKKMNDLSERYQMPVPWQEKIANLGVGIQQRIEILKLLAFDAELLILDEPTAVLTPLEIEAFLQRLKSLRSLGKTIVLITHKLKEVFAVADDVTVLKQGQVISSGPLHLESEQSLASKMVGFDFKIKEVPRTPPSEKTILEVKNLSAKNSERTLLEEIQFSMRSGEILGIAGVEGNGQSELIRALALPLETSEAPGSESIQWQGQILFEGKNILNLKSEEIRKQGLSLIPEDRIHQAMIPSFSAQENYRLGRPDLMRNFSLKSRELQNEVEKSFRQFSIVPAQPQLPLTSFSGGNQQKLVVARALGHKPRILIVAQPTRGVDIGAIEALYEALLQARNEGLSLLLISSELEELLRLSDRLLVLSKGRIAAELSREKFDLNLIGRLMGGLK